MTYLIFACAVLVIVALWLDEGEIRQLTLYVLAAGLLVLLALAAGLVGT